MSKKRRKMSQTRDAPAQQRSSVGGVMVCDAAGWAELIGCGYRPLMSCPEVQIAIGVYADLIANMTIHQLKNGEIGDERIRDGLSAKLDIAPNRWMTHQGFMSTIVRVAMSTGNQVTLPIYTAEGLLDDLVPLPPSRVSFIDQPGGGYVIRCGERTFEPDEVLHFPINPDPERPWVGRGFEALLGDVVKGIRQANATKQALMEKPMPSIIVRVDSYNEELKSAASRDQFLERFVLSEKNGRPWVLPAESFEVQQVKPASIADLAIDKNLELDKRTVAAIFGMPSFLLGVGDFDAEAYDWFVATKVMAVARVIEQELTKKLLYAPDRYFRLNSRSLLNYNLKQVVEMGGQLLDRLTISRNELRDWIGMAPREDMEELLALENYIPATKLGDQKKLMQGGGGDDA